MKKSSKIIREQKDEPLATKLRIVDFDDTLALTTERVRIETPDGHKMISSKEFAIYELLPGEKIDPEVAFDEFSQVDIKKAKPVPFISDLFKRFVDASGNIKVLILTARGQETEKYVMKFLEKKLGISSPESKVEFSGVNSKDPAAKVRVIENYLDSNPSINFVSFYDDSGKNVRAVSNFLKSRGISGDVRQVVEDEAGKIRLVRQSDERDNEELLNVESHKKEIKHMKISESKLRMIIRQELLSEQEEEEDLPGEDEPVEAEDLSSEDGQADQEDKNEEAKSNIISLDGDVYKYEITKDDQLKIEDTGDLWFTVAAGPKNVGKSFKLTDTDHTLYSKAKELHPNIVAYLDG